MKTFRHLYPDICAWRNIEMAYRRARRGKRSSPVVADFEYNQEEQLISLQDELIRKTYKPGPYHSFLIHEPKRRLISAAPFRDRVVHHALCNIIEPLFDRTFIFDSYANRVGKGTHRALERCQHYARRFRYVLQLDVQQFFPAVDHAILRAILADKIRDDDALWLIDQILVSGCGVLSEQYTMRWFADDDLLAATRSRGLPIGNLTSQFWANCYLNTLDQFVKHALHCRGYVRYVDDALLFADDKATLNAWHTACIERLAGLRLTVHPGAHPQPVGEGIPFLGFVVYPTHRRLKRRKGVHFRRRLKRLLADYRTGHVEQARVQASVRGWINHVRYGDTWGLRRALLRDVVL